MHRWIDETERPMLAEQKMDSQLFSSSYAMEKGEQTEFNDLKQALVITTGMGEGEGGELPMKFHNTKHFLNNLKLHILC